MCGLSLLIARAFLKYGQQKDSDSALILFKDVLANWRQLGYTLLGSAGFQWVFDFQISASGCWACKSP